MLAKGEEKIQDSTKREAILEVARRLFAEKGYEDTTIADIARGAGIAVGTVYLYFHNKHEIYTAVALNVEALIAEAFQNPQLLLLPFVQRIDAMVDALFQISHKHKKLMSMLQIDMHSNDEVELHKRCHESISNAISALFELAIEHGELAPFDTQMYAQILNLMGSSVIHQCFAIEQGEREELFREHVKEILRRLFIGPSLAEGMSQVEASSAPTKK